MQLKSRQNSVLSPCKHCNSFQSFATLISTKHPFVEIAKSSLKFETRLRKKKKKKKNWSWDNSSKFFPQNCDVCNSDVSKITEQILNDEWRGIDPRCLSIRVTQALHFGVVISGYHCVIHCAIFISNFRIKTRDERIKRTKFPMRPYQNPGYWFVVSMLAVRSITSLN